MDEISSTQAAVLVQTLRTVPKVKGEQRALYLASLSLVRTEVLLGSRLPFSSFDGVASNPYYSVILPSG